MLLLLFLAVPVVCLDCMAVHLMSFSLIVFCVRLRALITVGLPCMAIHVMSFDLLISLVLLCSRLTALISFGLPCMVMQWVCTQLSSIPSCTKLKASTCIMKALTCLSRPINALSSSCSYCQFCIHAVQALVDCEELSVGPSCPSGHSTYQIKLMSVILQIIGIIDYRLLLYHQIKSISMTLQTYSTLLPAGKWVADVPFRSAAGLQLHGSCRHPPVLTTL